MAVSLKKTNLLKLYNVIYNSFKFVQKLYYYRFLTAVTPC